MAETLTITDNRTGKQYEVPITDGTIRAMDLRQIKVEADEFGMMTYDPAFTNTAACRSRITFIDGDNGILWYRGYPIEQLAEHSDYLETAYLIIHGELPTAKQSEDWTREITMHTMLHENLKTLLEGFRYDAHPMGMFISTVGALSTFYPDAKDIFNAESRRLQTIRLIAKVPSIAAYAYRHSIGRPYVLPDNELSFAGNFLNMLFKMTEPRYKPTRCSSAPWTFFSSCTPTTSRTAAPTPCGASAARRPTPTRRWPARPPRSTARCTGAPTKPCCGCSPRSGRRTTSRHSSSASRAAMAG
jgi:citrate synthase